MGPEVAAITPITVNVEPDKWSAWIGLVGVVVGALIAGGWQFWRDRRQDRKERYRELRDSSDTLIAACNSIAVFLYQVPWPPGESREADVAWTAAVTRTAERAQDAAHKVARYGSRELGKQAEDLVGLAVSSIPTVAERDRGVSRQLSIRTARFDEACVRAGLRSARPDRPRVQPEADIEPTATDSEG